MAFVYVMMIYQQKSSSKLDLLKYDVSIINAGDFTVELDISEDAYNNFLSNEYNPKGKPHNISPGKYLKMYLKKKVDDIISRHMQWRILKEEEEAIEKDDSKGDSFMRRETSRNTMLDTFDEKKKQFLDPYVNEKYKVRVADITFAFNNYELIKLLKQRGTYIKLMQYDKIPAIND